ncbi:MAG: aminopeptidase [Candidatus Paceibacterota bacterium]
MYEPSEKILESYADVLVNFALGNGQGIAPGDVVYLQVPEAAKPLFVALYKAITKADGHVISHYTPCVDETHNHKRDFYEHASDEQLDHFPEGYYRGIIDEADHMLKIIAETDKQALKGIDSKKLMKRGKAKRPFLDWRLEEEGKGNLSWTIAAYATQAAADEANLTLEEYWQEIIHACYLDMDDPIEQWKKTEEKIQAIIGKLNNLEIQTIHIESENIDLHVKIGDRRRWEGGGGSNIPSYEIFTSPDWRGTEGTIAFNQPLYRYGNLIKGIKLTFEEGKVVEASAEENEQVLRDMIATDGADKVGEFSLTDRRFSRIGKFMAETLFDENTGAEHGNTHIALGQSYKSCLDGDESELSDEDWGELGFNNSSVHTDIISTEPRVATATLKDGSEVVIYKNGEFCI